MAPSSSQPHATAALDGERDDVRCATCLLCHTPASLTQSALDAGGDWRCARCGQRWDAARLATFTAYAAWVLSRDAATTRSESPSLSRTLASEPLGT
jgi:hypothetical protein